MEMADPPGIHEEMPSPSIHFWEKSFESISIKAHRTEYLTIILLLLAAATGNLGLWIA